MAQVAQPETVKKRRISSLFVPTDPEAVIIPTEKIIYLERRHWAILIQPFLETLAALILLTFMADGEFGAFGGFVVLAAIVLMFMRF